MSSFIGGITDAIGITNNKGAKEAANIAKDANAASIELSREQTALAKENLQFQKDQYEDWKAIYGDVQENLGEYYKNLNPDDVTALNLQNQQREYQTAMKQVKQIASQRGITNSGLEFSAMSDATFANAEKRAEIRSTADQKVAEQKLSFLGVGLGQGSAMLANINGAAGNVNSAYNTGVSAQTQIASNYISQNSYLSGQNINTMGDLAGIGLSFMTGDK